MIITQNQLKRIIKEEIIKEAVLAEVGGPSARQLAELHDLVDRLVTAWGPEDTVQELQDMAQEIKMDHNLMEAPEPGRGSPEEWKSVERQNVINLLAEDGVSVDVDSPITNEQLHAMLMIARGRTTVTVKNSAGKRR